MSSHRAKAWFHGLADGSVDGVLDRWLDPCLALAGFVCLEVEAVTSPAGRGPLLLNLVVVAVMTLSAFWRRRMPVVFFVVVGVCGLLLARGLTSTSSSQSTLTGLYTVLVPTYTVGAWASRGRSCLAMAAWVAGATLSVLIAQGGHLSSLVPALITAMAAWGVGLAMGALRQLASELDRRSAQLRSVRNERAHAAVAMERTRIARELQAVVAHGVAAMVLETEAAERLLDQDVAAADAALEVVEQMGREALGQMRRILGVLRRSDVRAVPTRGVQT